MNAFVYMKISSIENAMQHKANAHHFSLTDLHHIRVSQKKKEVWCRKLQ